MSSLGPVVSTSIHDEGAEEHEPQKSRKSLAVKPCVLTRATLWEIDEFYGQRLTRRRTSVERIECESLRSTNGGVPSRSPCIGNRFLKFGRQIVLIDSHGDERWDL